MRLDLTARRNLELLETMRSKEKRGSLLWVLDHTKTAMGKRLIRSWIDVYKRQYLDTSFFPVWEIFRLRHRRGMLRGSDAGDTRAGNRIVR